MSISGFYLRSHGGEDHAGQNGHVPVPESDNEDSVDGHDDSIIRNGVSQESNQAIPRTRNPICLAFAAGNRRALAAASMVPMLWSGGFYLSFVWMAIFMSELIDDPVPHAFGVNSGALLVSVCLFFPVAGLLSDQYGRRRTMTIGGIGMAVLSPLVVMLIGFGNALVALCSQSLLGVALSFWGAPMCAWLVEGFEPNARLTSVAIGYNLAQMFAGGIAPSVATIMVDVVGPYSPGWILTVLGIVSMTGLWCVAPPPPDSASAARSKASFEAVPRSDSMANGSFEEEQYDADEAEDADDELL